MRTLGDSPELGALADYLDFLDVHDRRALGVAESMEPAPMMPSSFGVPAQRSQPIAQRAGFTAQTFATPQAPSTRLRAAMIPAGRAITVPFGTSRPTLLNPGTPSDGTGFSPAMTALPAGAPVRTYSAAPTDQGMPAQQTSYLPAQGAAQVPAVQDPGTPPGDPNGGMTAGGSNGLLAGGTLGWLLLLAGGYYMYRSL